MNKEHKMLAIKSLEGMSTYFREAWKVYLIDPTNRNPSPKDKAFYQFMTNRLAKSIMELTESNRPN
jgi:hypothetical protein